MAQAARLAERPRKPFRRRDRRTVQQRPTAAEWGKDPWSALRAGWTHEARLATDAVNHLIYRVASAGDARGADTETVTLDGTWTLTPTHELALVRQTPDGRGDTLSLNGEITQVDARGLVFTRAGGRRGRTAQRLRLTGRWQADAVNRLTLLVAKADGAEDRLTFEGGWRVGPRHELLYQYQRDTDSGRRTRTLRFAGAWDLTQSDRLVYRLSTSSDSSFEFRASLERADLRAHEGRLVYRVGVEVARGRTRQPRVAFSGRWALHRDLSVSFELSGVGGRRQRVRFAATYALTPRQEIECALLGRRGEPLGVTVTFSRRWLGDARWFMRLGASGRDREAVAGVQFRF
jgi:hypothetical protein